MRAKAKDTLKRTAVALPDYMIEQLRARGDLSTVIRCWLERYLYLIKTAKVGLLYKPLNSDEFALLCEAIDPFYRGNVFPSNESIRMIVKDALRTPGLDHKGVDIEALIAKVGDMTLLDFLALMDLASRRDAVETNTGMDVDFSELIHH